MKVHRFVHEMRSTSTVFGRTSGAYVTFSGDGAYTDGKQINLPAMGMDKDLTTEQVMTMRGYVDHEAGHLRHSDMPRIMDFYKRCINNDREGLKILHNCVEDVWMEGRVVNDYPGSLKNLKTTNRIVKEREVVARKEMIEFIETGKVPESWSPELKKQATDPKTADKFKTHITAKLYDLKEMAGFAIKALNPLYEGDRAHQEFFDMMPEKLKEFAPMWAEQAANCKNSEECITLAKSIWELLQDDPELDESKPEDFDPESGAGMDEGEPGDVGDDEAREGDGKPTPGQPTDENGDPTMGNPMDEAGKALDEVVKGVLEEGGPEQDQDGPLKGGYRVLSTKDDAIYRRGKPMPANGESDLQEIVDSTDPTSYTKVVSQISGEVSTMKSKLKRALLAKDRRGWDFGRETGRLDSKRLVAASQGVSHVYKQRADITEENTVVTFLVDLSGSMSGTKVTVARDCVVALSECLAGSKITFKVVGFSNNGHPSGVRASGQYHRYEKMDTTVFKDFDQPMRTARSAVGQINKAVGHNNSDYDFIVQEMNDLKKRSEKRKVLFVLSDGSPACRTDASTSEHIRHCKSAIKEGSREGVECIGIGIQDSSVERIYDNNVVVNNVNELSTACFNKLTKLLVG